MAWAASLVGLAMGLLIVLNTLLVAVLERTREIGVLGALGWSCRRILTLVLLESLLLSAAGGLLGMALGYLGLNLLIMHPMLRGIVAVTPSLSAFGQQFLVTVVLGIGGGFLPAWRALNLNPVDALRDR
jgi:putative ABC transport system permease protein